MVVSAFLVLGLLLVEKALTSSVSVFHRPRKSQQ